MKQGSKIAMAAGATLIGSWASSADTLQTHRIPAVLALEAVGEAVATCAQQGYRETVTVLDTDGATIATLRGDGAGITLSIALMTRHTPAFHSKMTHWRWPNARKVRTRLRHWPSCRTLCFLVAA